MADCDVNNGIHYKNWASYYRWGLLTICLLAFALRLHLLEDIFLHDDEIKSQRLYVEQDPLQILTHYTANNHWLSSGLGHLMGYVGPQRFLLRWPAVFFGTLAAPLLGVAGYRLFKRRQEGLIAALLLSFSAFHIQWSQQFRGYTALLFFGLLAFLLLHQALQKGGRAAWLSFIAGVCLTVASHLFGVLMVLTLLVIMAGWIGYNVILRRRQEVEISWKLAIFLSILGVVAYFIYFGKVQIIDHYHTLPQVSWLQLVYYQLLATVPTLPQVNDLMGEIVMTFTAYPEPRLASALFGGPVILGTALSLRHFPRSAILLAIWLALPLSLVILAEFAIPGFFASERYLIFILPAWLLLVSRSLVTGADWLACQTIKAGRYQLLLSLIPLSLMLGYLGWLNLKIIDGYFADRAGHDWRRIAAYLAQQAGPGDLIICKQLPHAWPSPSLESEKRCTKELGYRLNEEGRTPHFPAVPLEVATALSTWFQVKEASQAPGKVWLVIWGEKRGGEASLATLSTLTPLEQQSESLILPAVLFNRLGETLVVEVEREPHLVSNLGQAIGYLAYLDVTSQAQFDYYLRQAQVFAYQKRIAEAHLALNTAWKLAPEQAEEQAYLAQTTQILSFNFLQEVPPPAPSLQEDFGQPPLLRLTGYTLPRSLRAGQASIMTTAWQVLNPVSTDYTIFLHLRDAAGQTVAQLDFRPFEGAYPTSQWTPGLTIIESRPWQLPPELQPGSYTLYLGLYHLETLTHLAPTREGLDPAVLLGEISVR